MRGNKASEAGPAWLGRLVYGGLVAAVAGVSLLALGLAQGWADPPRAGPLRWENDFKAGDGGWTLMAPADGGLATGGGALVAIFSGSAPEQWAVGLAPEPTTTDYTLEVAGAVTEGSPAYGLVFGWQDSGHYSALLINASGYAEAFQQVGDERVTWFGWQQWPHILVGTENNRLRVDVRGENVTLRVNDEVVVAVTSPATQGRVGLAALARVTPDTDNRVVFSWARLWAR